MDRVLTELLELYAACGHVLGGPRRRSISRVRGGPPTGLRLHQEALDARARVLGVLSSWCGLVVSEHGGRHPGRHSVPELVAFLRDHHPWLATHPAADDFAAEIHELVTECRRVVEPDDPKPRIIRRCRRTGCGCVTSKARLVPTELAALAVGVGAATIRKWASRGRLTRYGTRARAEYDLDELLDIHRSRVSRTDTPSGQDADAGR